MADKTEKKGWRTEKVKRTRAEMQKFADRLAEEMPADVEWHFGGSWRRGAPMVGDLDIVVVLPEENVGLDDSLFGGVELPKSVVYQRGGKQIAQGDLTIDGESVHVDFWTCTPKQRGAFLCFITGPKDLNIAQRTVALRKGLNLSQIGLLKDGVQIDDGTEEDVYAKLDLIWLEPAQRQAFAAPQGEVYEREVEGSKGQMYKVKWSGNQVSCSCRGFSFRKYCKHATAIREELGLQQ